MMPGDEETLLRLLVASVILRDLDAPARTEFPPGSPEDQAVRLTREYVTRLRDQACDLDQIFSCEELKHGEKESGAENVGPVTVRPAAP